MQYTEAQRLWLRDSATYNEKWLQQRIAENPALLGLGGELDVRDVERRQPGAGRLDLLLEDAETQTRYEVEIQLGPTDERHIIRTIEYWDIERRRYPQYEHVAVLVAEDITTRFLNVVSLFNGAVPIAAVQLAAWEVNGALTLTPTVVLQPQTLGAEDDSVSSRTVDRSWWLKKASEASVQLAERFFERFVTPVAPDAKPNYLQGYIGMARHGVADNVILLHVRKSFVIANFKVPREDELSERLEQSGLETLPYDPSWGRYRVRLRPGELETHADLLQELTQRAAGSSD